MHSSVLNMPVLHKLQTYPRNKFKAYYFKNTYLSIYCEMLSVRVLRTDQSNQIAIDLIMWSDTIENQLWITKRNLTISLFGPLPTLFMIICPQKDGQLLSNFPLYLRKDLIKMKVQQMVSQNYKRRNCFTMIHFWWKFLVFMSDLSIMSFFVFFCCKKILIMITKDIFEGQLLMEILLFDDRIEKNVFIITLLRNQKYE